MGYIEQEYRNRQKKLPLQIVMRTAGALFIMAASGISHQPPRYSSPETAKVIQSEAEFSFIPPILSEYAGPKPVSTPLPSATPKPTPESKPTKKDFFREYLAPKIYQGVVGNREQRTKEDSQYPVRTNSEFNQNSFNLLILGGRAEDTLSDLIMVYSYHLPTHSSSLLTIPRDVGSPEVYAITGIPGSARINQAYGLGGMKLTKTIVENATGLSMDFALRMDFEAFVNLIDTVGKIGIDISDDIKDEHAPAANGVDYEPFFLKAGYYEIDGLTALMIARSRGGEKNDDYARAKRMRDITSSFFKKGLAEGKRDFSYIGKLRGALEKEIKEGRIKPDFDLGIVFPTMIGPIPIGLGGDLAGLLWTQQFGEGWTLGEMPSESSIGLTRENVIGSAGVPGVAIDKIIGHSYLTEEPLDYWGPSRAVTQESFKQNINKPPK